LAEEARQETSKLEKISPFKYVTFFKSRVFEAAVFYSKEMLQNQC